MIMEEKQLTLSEVKNLLIGKYLHVEGDYTIWEGVVHTVTHDNIYSVRFGECYAVALTNADIKELQAKGRTGSTYLFNDREDCLNKIRRIQEVISAKTEHTTNGVWRQRWWDVFFEFVKMGAYSEHSINATSNIIKDAMKEMDNFFKDK